MEQNVDNSENRRPSENGAALMYIIIVGVVFLTLTVVFVFFPRSKYSELEKRDLAEFPEMNDYEGNAGGFTAAISSWFSDTEPYRDELMTLSMNIRSSMRGDFLPEEETVSFRPSDTTPLAAVENATDTEDDIESGHDSIPDSETPYDEAADGKAKLGDSGTIIIGKGENVRALMAFGGTAKGGGGYIDLLNTLAETFPTQNVYAMVAPLATEYYLPPKAAKVSNPQKPFIYGIRDRLSPNVKFVDIYSELSKHTKEDIYLRTDHHWAGLGGYYAAKKLAETAGVPFRGLDAYDRHEIKGFVGSMYGYSKDIAVKNAPETFVYYTPSQAKYDAEFVAYTLNRNFQITKESRPYRSSFFKSFKDGSGNAYLTFIGSDQVFVKVKTSTPGNRRLLIIKDSYGNAVPGNLFYSFNEVHVVDFRYFTHNLKKYVADNGITDIAVCFNVFNAYSTGSAMKVKRMLTQAGGVHAAPDASDAVKKDSKSTISPKDKKDPGSTAGNTPSDEPVINEESSTSLSQPENAGEKQEPEDTEPVTPEINNQTEEEKE